MKADIHPKYDDTHRRVLVRQHASRPSRTKAGELHVELCNECHPFFTGKQKLVDTGGRVERFQRRYGQRKTAPATPRPRPRRDARPAAPPGAAGGQARSPRPRRTRAGLPAFSARSAGGAALAADGEAWVLADEQPERALGPGDGVGPPARARHG